MIAATTSLRRVAFSRVLSPKYHIVVWWWYDPSWFFIALTLLTTTVDRLQHLVVVSWCRLLLLFQEWILYCLWSSEISVFFRLNIHFFLECRKVDARLALGSLALGERVLVHKFIYQLLEVHFSQVLLFRFLLCILLRDLLIFVQLPRVIMTRISIINHGWVMIVEHTVYEISL